MSRVNFKSWLGSWQEWVSVILLFLALVIAVRSIEQVNWIKPQPSLILVLALAMLTCLLLVRSRWRKTVVYPIVIILGAAVTVWQAANLMPPSETVSKVTQFISALITTSPNEGTIHFAVFLILSTWVIGYISTWFILRKQNAWVGALLGGAVIMINLIHQKTAILFRPSKFNSISIESVMKLCDSDTDLKFCSSVSSFLIRELIVIKRMMMRTITRIK